MHSARLLSICRREMGGHHADADDALAQAMMKAWRALPVFAPRIVSLEAWLIRLTRNVCRDVRRGQVRRDRLDARTERLVESDPEWESDAARTAGPPDELGGDPGSLLEALPERLRGVFVLRFVEHMSYADVATRLALTRANVRKRVQQGRALLRALRERPATASPPRLPLSARAAPSDPPTVRCGAGFEIPAPTAYAGTVRVRLPAGDEGVFRIYLDRKPVRQRQKIATLRKNVAQHPKGWKNRLRLADLLYETGEWAEAAEGYRHVLGKRPWLLSVSLRLGEILRATAAEDDALALYQRALPLTCGEATRRHLEGLIACCRHDFAAATAAFQDAVGLEPDNGAHGRALEAARLEWRRRSST
jgi:RNA polymerase sigma factor (sigma-70 family)